MSDEELIKYFIERTDERLQEMDNKIDELLSFKWQIIGGSVLLSILVNIGLAFIVK